MKRKLIYVVIWVTWLTCFLACEKKYYFQEAPPADTETPKGDEDEDVWENLSHPSLFFDSIGGERLREEVTTTRAAVWARVQDYMNGWGAPAAYRPDESGDELYQRDQGTRTAALAFAAYITGADAWIAKCKSYALASCNYATWGKKPDKTTQDYGLVYGHQLLGLALAYDLLQDKFDDASLNTIRQTLYQRVKRQYTAYKDLSLGYLQNHTWINCAGMLAAAIVLRETYPEETKVWVDFVDGVLTKSSKLLQPDGASQEGIGYWQYGMEYLLQAFEMARVALEKDYYSNSTWWNNTGLYAMYMMTPRNAWQPGTQANDLIDIADCPRYSWYGPEHLYRRIAVESNNQTLQWFADRVAEYSQYQPWQSVLWYNPSLGSTPPESVLPLMHHFTDMGIVVARDGWDGNESMVVYKCGAPVGKNVHALATQLGSVGDNVGHTHPDANHFVVFANGEYLVKNNGYVKRRTWYHNTLVVDNQGQWGQSTDYWTPMNNGNLVPSRDPSITSVVDANGVVTINGAAGNAYADATHLSKFDRKLIYIRPANTIIVYDDIAVSQSHNLRLLFFPESDQITQMSPSVVTISTAQNNVRFENLTPTTSSISLGTENIEERSSTATTPTPLITISKTALSWQQVTAISWSKAGSGTPVVATYKEENGIKKVTVNGADYTL